MLQVSPCERCLAFLPVHQICRRSTDPDRRKKCELCWRDNQDCKIPPPTTLESTDEPPAVNSIPSPGDAPSASADKIVSPIAFRSLGKRAKIAGELEQAVDSDEERPPAKKVRLGELLCDTSYPCCLLIATSASQTVQDLPEAGPSSRPMDFRLEESAGCEFSESAHVSSIEMHQASSTALSLTLKHLGDLETHHRIALSLEQDFLRVIESKITATREQLAVAQRREAKGKWREE